MAAPEFKSCRVSDEPVELSRFVLLHLRCMQVLGLCPISLRLKRGPQLTARRSSNESQWHQQLWLYVHLIAFTLLHLFTIVRQKTLIYNNDSFGKFNDAFNLIIACLAHYVVLLETIFRRQAMHDFLLQYTQLHGAWCTYSYKQEKHVYRRSVMHCCCFLLLNICVELFYILQIHHRSKWIQFYLVFIPNVLICRFRLLQFIFYLQLIEGEVEQLNRNIVRLAAYTRSLQKNCIRINHALESEICAELKTLLQNYAGIYKLAELLKQCTGLSILVTYISTYTKILADCYWSYWLIYNQQHDLGPLTGFILTVPSAANLFQLFLSSRNCMRSVESIAHNVHKIRHQVEDLNTSSRILNFSLQLLHQQISFDAHGCFMISCNMVRGMLSSITTFMLFYIQFMPKFKNI